MYVLKFVTISGILLGLSETGLAKSCKKGDNEELKLLKNAMTELVGRVSSLELENAFHKKLITSQQTEIKHLQNEMKFAQAARSSEDKMIYILAEEMENIKQNVNEKHLTSRLIENEVAVAFYGKLDTVTPVGQDDIIKFNNIITNIGQAYSSFSGLFIAPVAGIYVFSTSVMTEHHLDTHLGIYINDQIKTNIKLYGTEHEYDTMSQTAVYYLNKSDTVSVRHYEGNKTLHGSYTTLTAFLLNQDYGQIIGGSANIVG